MSPMTVSNRNIGVAPRLSAARGEQVVSISYASASFCVYLRHFCRTILSLGQRDGRFTLGW